MRDSMNHQITLEELGIIPKSPKQEPVRDVRKYYAYPCGGCICDHCANSVECSDICDGEMEFGCFDCDECKRYDASVTGTDKYKTTCNSFKETGVHMRSYAEKKRRQFHVIKQGGQNRGSTEKDHRESIGGKDPAG